MPTLPDGFGCLVFCPPILRHLISCLLLLVAMQTCWSQNLVPNHDFDFHTWCPIGRGLIGWAVPWYSPNYNTSDFCHVCSGTDSYSGVPGNRWGNQFPYSGDGYAGIRTWLSREFYVTGVNYREYLAVGLTDTLIAGENYLLSFKVSVGDNAAYFSDDIGMYLSKDSISRDTIIRVTPHLANPEGNIIRNMTDWVEISGNYVASGGERFLVIGNFLNDEETTLELREDNNEDLLPSTYYYIDDVRVEGCTQRFPQYIITASDSTLCPGEMVELSVPELDSAIYTWEDGSTNRIRQINTANTYNISIDLEGCIRRDTITIDAVNVPDVNLGNDTVLCPGNFLSLTFEGEADSYFWNDQSTNRTLAIKTPGLYTLTVSKEECVISDSIQIDYEEKLTALNAIDTLKCQGTTILLTPSDIGKKYLWQDLSEAESFQATFQGEYWVDVISHCTIRRQYFHIIDESCSCESFIPNVFTPNQDGVNEDFRPKLSQGGVSNYELNIFDRYGRLIFSSKDVAQAWEGNYKQQLAPEGVYYWILQYDCKEGNEPQQKVLKGHVSLLR